MRELRAEWVSLNERANRSRAGQASPQTLRGIGLVNSDSSEVLDQEMGAAILCSLIPGVFISPGAGISVLSKREPEK